VPTTFALPSPRDPGERRVGALVITFSVMCALAILASLAFQVFSARTDVLRHHSQSATILVRVLEQQTIASLDAAELALSASERAIRLLPKDGPQRAAAIDQLFQTSIARLPYLRAMWLLDADGNLVQDSDQSGDKLNLADREYFQIHRDEPSLGLYIDRPMLGKQGVPFIGLSRRINRPDGSFGGVIVASLEPDYLRRFYDTIRGGTQGMVALVRRDGTLMLQVPGAARAPREQRIALPSLLENSRMGIEGSYDAVNEADGVERTFFYRHVPRRPLLVVVGVGKDDMLADWRRTSWTYFTVSLGFLLLVGWLSHLALKELRRRHALDVALRASDAAMKAAQQLAHIGSWRLNLDTLTGHWSDEMYRVMGVPLGSAVPQFDEFLELIHPADRHIVQASADSGTEWTGEVRTNPHKGPLRYLHTRSTLMRNAAGEPAALIGTLQDVTERRVAQEKLRLSARVFEQTGDGIIVSDSDNMIVAVNAAFERITGFAEAEVLQHHQRTLHAGLNDDAFLKALWQTVLREGQWRGEIWGRRKNGDVFPQWLVLSAICDQHGRTDGYVGVFTDLSEIRDATEQLQFLNNHDPLTRLPNRALLNDRLQQAIEAARPERRQLAILLLNIDRLKRVNEGIGHDAGDLLLREVGLRLQSKLQPGDTLARLGSDEFVLLLTHIDDTDDVNARAQQMLELVAQPFAIDGHELTVTASVGIALYPDDGIEAGELIKNADAALTHVKEGGRNSFRYFTAEMNIRALHWMSVEHRLRGALAADELLLHYQPQMSLADGALSGVEALIRWHSVALGAILPAEFIPLAEDTGLILPVGEWVLRSACRQGKAWQDAGLPGVRIAVNVSGRQVAAGNLPDVVRSALEDSGLAPRWLAIELTESVLMKETGSAMRQVAELRAMGISVALDDFGTGYSALSYLSSFALDKIKLDQSLVRNITLDPKSAAIATATIGLAHGLGLTVVAEGVETEAQLEFLRGAQCDEIQGFLFSRPVPAGKLAELLAQLPAALPGHAVLLPGPIAES
jgi:diguanylate cyclase (GGDEF)-like protein/PAS domain S-box-containing protein